MKRFIYIFPLVWMLVSVPVVGQMQSQTFAFNTVPPKSSSAATVESTTTSIHSFDIFPSPVQTDATISYTLKSAVSVQYDVYDGNGKTVLTKKLGLQQEGSHSSVLNVSELQPGIYRLSIHAGNTSTDKYFMVLR